MPVCWWDFFFFAKLKLASFVVLGVWWFFPDITAGQERCKIKRDIEKQGLTSHRPVQEGKGREIQLAEIYCLIAEADSMAESIMPSMINTSIIMSLQCAFIPLDAAGCLTLGL